MGCFCGIFSRERRWTLKAYDEAYLPDAMEALGEAFDCAVCRADMPLQTFFELFVSTGIADAFGSGNPRYVAGMSGVELFLDVCYRAGLDVGVALVDQLSVGDGPEYWCGWSVAFWQWSTGRPFRSIARVVTMDEVLALYHPWHEASEECFADEMERRSRRLDAPLKGIREERGLTQQELADASGVSLRAIQQYEQRRKNINHARGASLCALASVLGCRIEDLLEYPLEVIKRPGPSSAASPRAVTPDA